MAYNSSSFVLSASSTLNLPSRTYSILISAPTSNASTNSVRLGGGSPVSIRPGESKSISIGEILTVLELSNIMGLSYPISPTLFMTSLSATIAGGDTLYIDTQEWRTS